MISTSRFIGQVFEILEIPTSNREALKKDYQEIIAESVAIALLEGVSEEKKAILSELLKKGVDGSAGLNHWL